jgi:hypothetical protein
MFAFGKGTSNQIHQDALNTLCTFRYNVMIIIIILLVVGSRCSSIVSGTSTSSCCQFNPWNVVTVHAFTADCLWFLSWHISDLIVHPTSFESHQVEHPESRQLLQMRIMRTYIVREQLGLRLSHSTRWQTLVTHLAWNTIQLVREETVGGYPMMKKCHPFSCHLHSF